MIRMMGFVTGVAVAAGLMVYLFGWPGATPEPRHSVDTARRSDSLVASANTHVADDPVPEWTEPQTSKDALPIERASHRVSVNNEGVLDSSSAPPIAPAAQIPEPESAAVDIQQTPGAVPAATESDDLMAAPTTRSSPPIAVATDAPMRALQWHAFWSPFKSRIAADGFVRRLEAVTGFDYRVVQIDTGVYEVAVGYENDVERRDKLMAISEATGLEMPTS